MKQKISVLMLVLLLAAGCSSGPDVSAPSETMLIPDISRILETRLYDNVYLEGTQTLDILDVNGEWALCAVKDWYLDAAGETREQGFQYLTKALLIISCESGRIAEQFHWTGNYYCAGGVLLQNHTVIYAAVDVDGGSPAPYQLMLQTEDHTPEPISLSGTCTAWDRLELARLNDRELVCSYWDRAGATYGLSKVNIDGTIDSVLVNPITDSDAFTTTKLSHNGENYLYWISSGTETVFVLGNVEGMQAQFKLPENEQIFDCCLCEDGILSSSAITDQEGHTSTYLIWRSLAGEELERSFKEPFQQMQAVGNCAFALGSSHKIYAIATAPDKIQSFFDTVGINVTNISYASFYDTGDGKALLHIDAAIPKAYSCSFIEQSELLENGLPVTASIKTGDFLIRASLQQYAYQADKLNSEMPFQLEVRLEYIGPEEQAEIWHGHFMYNVVMFDASRVPVVVNGNPNELGSTILGKGKPYLDTWTGRGEYKIVGGFAPGSYTLMVEFDFYTYTSDGEKVPNLCLLEIPLVITE